MKNIMEAKSGRKRKMMQIDKVTGAVIATYESAAEAAAINKFKCPHLLIMCARTNYRNITAYGYLWSYAY